MSGIKQATVDCWVGLLCVLGGGWWSYTARTTISGDYDPAVAGPQMFPVLLGLILVLLGLILIIVGCVSRKKISEGPVDMVDKPDLTEIRIVLSTFALLVVYGFLLEKLGFLIATPIIVVFAFLAVLRIYSWRLILAMAIGLTFGCYIVLGKIAGTYLPRGTWLQ